MVGHVEPSQAGRGNRTSGENKPRRRSTSAPAQKPAAPLGVAGRIKRDRSANGIVVHIPTFMAPPPSFKPGRKGATGRTKEFKNPKNPKKRIYKTLQKHPLVTMIAPSRLPQVWVVQKGGGKKYDSLPPNLIFILLFMCSLSALG